MFQRAVLNLAIVAAVVVVNNQSAWSQQYDVAAVAILLPVGDATWEDSVCIAFDGGTPQESGLQLEEQMGMQAWLGFGDFQGLVLLPTDAIYVSRGGRREGVVWEVFQRAPPPEHGVMFLGNHMDYQPVVSHFVRIEDGIVNDVPEAEATHWIIILYGFVRG